MEDSDYCLRFHGCVRWGGYRPQVQEKSAVGRSLEQGVPDNAPLFYRKMMREENVFRLEE